ncbi:MAG TPA: hypothetical protein PLP07_01880 [Pyrinomonadaceae bacterium]|nr:hypothetical protein [Chloracidobacterium sp.]MBP9934447.1 hypothetical protein [Pyrinomonadaceae bacterium]MBK7802570.1 hypothetical protein [Chloracidobacterium sp.]MBK9437425.1 hypothetical protein [Chloracidobacterium sp.]MBK9766154.1 hypothetical protein [Chloracidobacterium sp.]
MLFSLTQPNFPNAAIGIECHSVSAIALTKHGRSSYSVKQAATIGLANGVIDPSFLEINITDPHEFRASLEAAVQASGLLNQKRWSIALPSNSARSAILTLDAEPVAKQETEEILDWKAEQTFGAPAAQLRIARQKISPNREGRPRYFATAIALGVIDEYETLFESMGWKAGLILPRAVGEANWLLDRAGKADSLLISEQSDGFTALLLRGDEPSVVRTVTCLPAEIDDEVFRLLMFYNDRFGANVNEGYLDRVLLIGRDLVPERITKIAAEALGRSLVMLRPEDVGLSFPESSFNFDEIAAPAALAALA